MSKLNYNIFQMGETTFFDTVTPEKQWLKDEILSSGLPIFRGQKILVLGNEIRMRWIEYSVFCGFFWWILFVQ